MELVGWRLSSGLDEIPDLHAIAVITAFESVLVFVNDQNSCWVRSPQDFSLFMILTIIVGP